MLKSLLKKIVLPAASFCALGYLAAVSYLFLRQEALLFFPDPETPADAAVFAAYDTAFSVDDQTLDGWYIPGTSGTTGATRKSCPGAWTTSSNSARTITC